MTRTRGSLITVLGLAVLCGAFPAGGQGLAGKRVADLGWLAGTWVGSVESGDLSEETWTAPASGSMLGMWRWISGGRPRVLELLAITEESERPVLRLRHFDGALKAWEEKDAPNVLPLVRSGPAEAAFEGVQDGKTLRLTYRRTGDRLDVVLEKPDGRETYTFTKAD